MHNRATELKANDNENKTQQKAYRSNMTAVDGNGSYANGEVFVYTPIHANRDEQNEDFLPNSVFSDVIRVRVDPSVTSIHASAFERRKKLAEMELCEGLVQIEDDSFAWCDQSITKINIPISLRRINDWAFHSSLRCPIYLHDGIESIGNWNRRILFLYLHQL